MRRRRNGGGLIIGLSTSNMMSVGLPGISGAPSTGLVSSAITLTFTGA